MESRAVGQWPRSTESDIGAEGMDSWHEKPFGMTYGGPGGTIGPGIVFGFLAGRHAAARS